LSEEVFDRLDHLIREKGERGLTILLLFKTIKSNLLKIMKEQQTELGTTEKQLDDFCLKKAKELYKLGKRYPSERDIEEILILLRRKEISRGESDKQIN